VSDVAIAIVAGGQSSRMGIDKSFAEVLGRPLIEHVLAQAAGLGRETFIVTNSPERYAYLGVPLVPDALPGVGALGGLYTALRSATRPHVLCWACDLPFVVRPLIDYLLGLAPTADAIVPRLAGEAEPFRGIYARACAEPIRAMLDAGQRRVVSFFSAVRVRYVDDAEIDRFDPRHLSFFNVNTPADLEQARRLAESLNL
jgi:molybdopterin-guanine dinucleotide biosynthesis protein A